MFWWTYFVALFLTFRGEGNAWRYFWAIIWSLIIVHCTKQIAMLIFNPSEGLKEESWMEFRWIVALTRMLAIGLIFVGVLWANGKHMYSDSEYYDSSVGLPAFAIDNQTGFALSISSGHAADSWLLPLGVVLAAYPFCTVKRKEPSSINRVL